MRVLQGIAALILAIMLVVTLLVGQGGFLVNRTLLHTDFYMDVLIAEQALPDIRDHLLQGALANSALPPEVQSSLMIILSEAITSTWMEEQLRGALDNLLAYLKGKSSLPEGEISLVEVKSTLADVATQYASRRDLPAIQAKAAGVVMAGMAGELPDGIPVHSLMAEEDWQVSRLMAGWLTRLGAISVVITVLLVILLLAVDRRHGWSWVAGSFVAGGGTALALSVLWHRFWLPPAYLLEFPLYTEAAEILALRVHGLLLAALEAAAGVLRGFSLFLMALGLVTAVVPVVVRRRGVDPPV